MALLPSNFPQNRSERLIAAGRVVLAASSLLAIRLDPTKPAKYAEFAYELMAIYVLYSALLAALIWRMPVPHGVLALATHVLDLALFSLFLILTEGPSSPFFLYFIFSVLCATLRWQWQGALWTGLTALGMYAALGIYAAEVLDEPGFELNRVVIRTVYLGVVAVLVGYLGSHEARTRGEISRLAAWRHALPTDARELVRTLLADTAALLRAPRLVLAWEEPEEPWLNLGVWACGEFECAREPPAKFVPLVAETLAEASFFCPDARRPEGTVVRTPSSEFLRWEGEPVGAELRSRFDVRGVLSLPVRGEIVEGRLFVLDRPEATSDDLLLAEIAVRQATDRMDLFYLLDRLKHSAAAEERMRLARDLHDGLLQSLAVMALRVQTARRLLAEDRRAAQATLEEVQDQLVDDQRSLRIFVHDLKLAAVTPPEATDRLAHALGELAARIERHWGLHVQLTVERLEPWIAETLGRELYHMVHEAVVNAARHAGACTVRIRVVGCERRVRITVADNGRGFPFVGHYNHAALGRSRLGPASLKGRITSLGGTLAIDSGPRGARLEIILPRQRTNLGWRS